MDRIADSLRSLTTHVLSFIPDSGPPYSDVQLSNRAPSGWGAVFPAWSVSEHPAVGNLPRSLCTSTRFVGRHHWDNWSFPARSSPRSLGQRSPSGPPLAPWSRFRIRNSTCTSRPGSGLPGFGPRLVSRPPRGRLPRSLQARSRLSGEKIRVVTRLTRFIGSRLFKMDPRSSCRSLLRLLAREKGGKGILVSLKMLGQREIDACLNITKLRSAVNGIYFSFIIN